MPEDFIEVEGSFADLGLDQPGQVTLPTYGVSPGTHKAVVSRAAFVQNKSDSTKKNLLLEYTVQEANNANNGKSISETKPCNKTDKPEVKGYLAERLMQLGIPVAEQGALNVKTLEGVAVYVTVNPQRDNPQYMRVTRVQLDNDAAFTGGTPASSPSATTPGAVSADSIGY
jgi:hypothetical protein